jgi:D-cysteine desulfhydrase
VPVCDNRDYFAAVIGRICAAFERRWPSGVEVEAADVELLDGYVGLGSARSRSEELDELIGLARREALLLDPVYTGKAFFGMSRELLRDRRCLGDRVVFLHTGGIFGLFPIAEQLAPLL